MTGALRKLTSYWPLRLQEWTSVICCLAMVAGLLFSRAILSVSMILLVLNALHPQRLPEVWKATKQNLFVISCGLFFLCYVLSGLWSADTAHWMNDLQVKLPFLLFPFAMLQVPVQQMKYRKVMVYGMLSILTAGMAYSFLFLLFVPDYLKFNRHWPSPVEGDYIRFTTALVFGIQLAGWFLVNRKKELLSKTAVYLLAAWIIAAVLYIHLQAAKSGVLCFYVLLGIFVFHRLAGTRTWLLLVIIPGMVAAGILSVMFVPPLHRQYEEVAREQAMWQANNTADFAEGVSLLPRLLSYKIGTDLLRQQPVTGTGAGDIKAEIDKVYKRDYPQIPQEARLLPHNQFLCTALAIGIPLSCSLLLMAFAPLWGSKGNIIVLSGFFILLVGLLIEPLVETQYGIFVYLYFTMLGIVLTRKPAMEGGAPLT